MRRGDYDFLHKKAERGAIPQATFRTEGQGRISRRSRPAKMGWLVGESMGRARPASGTCVRDAWQGVIESEYGARRADNVGCVGCRECKATRTKPSARPFRQSAKHDSLH